MSFRTSTVKDRIRYFQSLNVMTNNDDQKLSNRNRDMAPSIAIRIDEITRTLDAKDSKPAKVNASRVQRKLVDEPKALDFQKETVVQQQKLQLQRPCPVQYCAVPSVPLATLPSDVPTSAAASSTPSSDIIPSAAPVAVGRGPHPCDCGYVWDLNEKFLNNEIAQRDFWGSPLRCTCNGLPPNHKQHQTQAAGRATVDSQTTIAAASESVHSLDSVVSCQQLQEVPKPKLQLQQPQIPPDWFLIRVQLGYSSKDLQDCSILIPRYGLCRACSYLTPFFTLCYVCGLTFWFCTTSPCRSAVNKDVVDHCQKPYATPSSYPPCPTLHHRPYNYDPNRRFRDPCNLFLCGCEWPIRSFGPPKPPINLGPPEAPVGCKHVLSRLRVRDPSHLRALVYPDGMNPEVFNWTITPKVERAPQ